MTWELKVDPVQSLATINLSEGFTPLDFKEVSEAMLKHPDFSPDLRLLVVCTNVVASGFTGDAVANLAMTPSSFSTASRRAIVASTDLGFGIARMFGRLKVGSTDKISVFRDLEEALSWLESGED